VIREGSTSVEVHQAGVMITLLIAWAECQRVAMLDRSALDVGFAPSCSGSTGGWLARKRHQEAVVETLLVVRVYIPIFA